MDGCYSVQSHSTIGVMQATGKVDVDSSPRPAPLTQLSEEESMFQTSVRQFARERLAPHVRAMDEAGVFRKELLTELFELGLMAVDIPEEYGGQGGTFLPVDSRDRRTGQGGPLGGRDRRRAEHVVQQRASALGQRRAEAPLAAARSRKTPSRSYALSEAGSGSDAFALTTRAVEDGDDISAHRPQALDHQRGRSRLVPAVRHGESGSGLQRHHGVSGRARFPGFAVGKKEDKLGIRASSTCEVILDDCRVPKANVIGEVGKGYKIAIETLNEGRIGIGAQMTGLAQGALDHALAYAKQRKQFGKPIAEFQGVQFDLAEMAVDVEAARLMIYNAARLRDAGQPFVTEAAMGKYFASQVAERVASRAVEVFGGVGFTKDYPVEKLYRDAKIGRIYEGTSNMQRLTIAKEFWVK